MPVIPPQLPVKTTPLPGAVIARTNTPTAGEVLRQFPTSVAESMKLGPNISVIDERPLKNILQRYRQQGLDGQALLDAYANDPIVAKMMPGRASGTPTSSDPVVNDAFDTASNAMNYLTTTYGRNGWDNKGSDLNIAVHVANPDKPSEPWDNASWSTNDLLSFGTAKPYARAADVAMHELGHAIMQASIYKSPAHNERAGKHPIHRAVGESFGDVMAYAYDTKNWKLGEDLGAPLRDAENPLGTHMSQVPKGHTEEHDLSEIPTHAAYLFGTKMGREKMGQVWYKAVTEHMSAPSGFKGLARATLDAATALYGRKSTEVSTLLASWNEVGINPKWQLAQTAR